MSLKNKFNRVAEDKSQLQEFANKVCGSMDDGEGEFSPILSEEQIINLIQDAFSKGEIHTTFTSEEAEISEVEGVIYVKLTKGRNPRYIKCDFGEYGYVEYTYDNINNYTYLERKMGDGDVSENGMYSNILDDFKNPLAYLEGLEFKLEDYSSEDEPVPASALKVFYIFKY